MLRATLDCVRDHPDARTTLDIHTLAARVAARRNELRLEQIALAEKAGLSRAYISRLEGALVPNPKLFDLARVAAALEVPLATLLAPEQHVVETRYSHEWAELQRQTDGLPAETRERVLRGFLESVELLHTTADLARRN